MSNILVMSCAILVAACDVFGEYTNIHGAPGGIRSEGNVVEASKLGHIVDEEMYSASNAERIISSNATKKSGIRIWDAAANMRRFSSSQFFHNNRPNCAVLDVVIM